MDARRLFNNSILLPLSLILLAVLSITNCKKDDPYGEFANMSPDVWAPQTLTIADISIHEKTLVWVYQITNIEGFRLDRKVGNGDWELAYRTFPKEVRLWNDQDIIPDELLTYHYRICAFAGDHQSAYNERSSEIVFPAPMMANIEKITDIKYKISWLDMSTGEQGFKLDHKVGGGEWEMEYAVVPENATSFTDTNVFKSTQIQYRVYAYYNQSNSDKITVDSDAEISGPTELHISENSLTSITLSWDDNSNYEEGFKIERKMGNDSWKPLTSTNASTYRDEDFEVNTTIQYRVCAYIENYQTSWITKTHDSHISEPANFEIERDEITTAKLSWDYSEPGVEGFIIERKLMGGSWEQLATVETTNYEDNFFELNEQYIYRVCAYFGEYKSSWTEADFDGAIPAPENLQIIQNSATSATLTWDYAFSEIEGFKLERQIDAGNWELVTENINPNQNNFTDDELNLHEHDYRYRIYALFSSFHSNYAEVVLQYTPSIGEFYKGGIVFYRNYNGGGLVCAESDQSTNADWDNAVEICSELVLNGYSDWYLPPRDELNRMYLNLHLNGLGGFVGDFYWSSTEYSSAQAFMLFFYTGISENKWKYYNYRVRAVRAF